MITLALDASTYRGTLAVLDGRTVMAAAESAMRGAHAEALMPAVEAVLRDAGVALDRVERVICGEGPGSFTSLRIAGALAKGICYGREVPLYAASSLGLALAVSDAGAGTFVVTQDALRDEWYAALFSRDESGGIAQRSHVSLVPRDQVDAFAREAGATILGAAIGGPAPHASGVVSLLDEIERQGPVDLDSWEPAYGRLAEAQVKWEASHGRPLPR